MMQGKVALVTGGVGAIGFEVCAQLAAAGAAVIINGRDAARCTAAADQIRAVSPDYRILSVVADVSDFTDCVRLIDECETTFGRLDVVVHCALSPLPGLSGPFEMTDPGQYAALMQQAICAILYLSRAAIPALKRAGGGTIIAFPSDAGKVAAPNQTMVGTTRAAVMMFMRSLALEVSAHAIRCNCIAPTFVDTPGVREAATNGPHASRIASSMARAKLGLPTPAELAALAVFLCGPAGAHLTGQVISVNGGLSAA